MKKTMVLSSVMVLVILLALAVGPGLAQGPEPTEPITAQAAVGTAFTYQGRLTNGGSPANGACDFQFSLWDSLSNLTGQIGTTQTKTNVTVSEGLFTVQLDFGTDAFTGDARWLQIAVRCPAGSGTYTTLSPRQPLTTAPYALSLRPGATIHNKATSGTTTGLSLRSDAGDGLYVYSAGDGLYVGSAGDDGVHVHQAGTPSTTTPSASKNGFQVEGAQGDGLNVGRADVCGVYVDSAGNDGVYVGEAGNASTTTPNTSPNGFEVAGAQGFGLSVGRADLGGVYVNSAGNDGVYVYSAGTPSTTSPTAAKNGFEVAGAQGDGLWVGRADLDGVYVNSAGDDGMTVWSAGGDGVHVNSAGGNGVYVNSADDYGVYVSSAGDYGVCVGSSGWTGVYVNSAGNDGVYVGEAGDDGVYANTTQASHNYGLYTNDNLYSLNYHLAGAMMLVAQSGDGGNLEPGDVVAVSGAGAAFAEGESPVALVRRAGPGDGAVMGVVYHRLVAEREVEEVQRDGQVEQQTSLHTRSAEGPIAPGDYLLVVVLGPAQVKVTAASGAGLRPGDLLTTAPNGQAAKAAPVKVDETTSYMPGAVIGQAMSALDSTQGTDLVWVLVMPR